MHECICIDAKNTRVDPTLLLCPTSSHELLKPLHYKHKNTLVIQRNLPSHSEKPKYGMSLPPTDPFGVLIYLYHPPLTLQQYRTLQLMFVDYYCKGHNELQRGLCLVRQEGEPTCSCQFTWRPSPCMRTKPNAGRG